MELDFGGETSGQGSGVAKVAAQLVSTSISAGSLQFRTLPSSLSEGGSAHVLQGEASLGK